MLGSPSRRIDGTGRVADVDEELNVFALERDIPSLTSQKARCEFNPLTHFNTEDTTGGGADGGALGTTWINPHDPLSDLDVEEASSNAAQRLFPRESKPRGAFDACISVAAVFGLAIVLNDQSNPLGQLVRAASPTPPAAPAAPPPPRLKARVIARAFAPLFQQPWTTDDRADPAVIPARYAMFSGIPNLVVRPSAPVLPRPTLPPRTIATAAAILTAPLTTTVPGSPTLASSPPPFHVPVTSTLLAPATLETPVLIATSQQASDTGAIHTVLGQYRNAFSGLDTSAAKAVWPSVDVRALDRAFDQLEQQALEFAKCEIDVEGVRATVSCDGSARYVPKVGNRSTQVAARHWRFNLRKVNQTWQIEEVDTR